MLNFYFFLFMKFYFVAYIQTDTTLYFVDRVYFGNSRSIDSIKSDKKEKNKSNKILSM